MNIKILTLFVLVLFSLSFAVLANSAFVGNGIQLLLPLNNTYDTDGSIIFHFNVSGNTSIHAESGGYTCQTYTNNTGSWAATGGQVTNVTNATNHVSGGSSFANRTNNATLTGLNDLRLSWTVGCFAPGNSTVVYPTNTESPSNINNTVIIDTINPVLTRIFNQSWYTNGRNVNFSISVSDTNPGQCVFQTNLNETSNRTGMPALYFNTTANVTGVYTSGVPFQFYFGNITTISSGVPNWTDNNSAYLWNSYCNDSAGNGALLSSVNISFFVDSVAPTEPNQTFPTNYTKSTDRTPVLSWLNATELNFSLYQVQVDDNSNFSSPEYERNITVQGTNLTLVTSGVLSFDIDYYWRVTSYDLANNSATSSTVFTYRIDGTCGTIVADIWNVCGIVNTNAINASTLCDQTSCAFVAQYNRTHQFQTHTAGSSTFDELRFVAANEGLMNESSVAFIFTESTNKSWENRTWQVDRQEIFYNLTNHSTGWNIVPILNQTTTFNFDKLERSLNSFPNASLATGQVGLGNASTNSFNNSNVSKFMSGYFEYNASGSRYVPYVANRSFNNNTQVKYGDAVWIHFNKSVQEFLWNSSGEIS